MSEWKEFTITDLADIYNEKRVPLSKMERINKQGKYPYYGASGIVDYLDEYIFDGEYVLISEDGENLKTRKTPIAFKASGKFWVNNHAHILQGKKDYLNDLLIYYFASIDLNPYITGAVQPKLNKTNLLEIPILLPQKEEEQKQLAEVLRSIDNKRDFCERQNKTLEEISQTLFRQWFIEKSENNSAIYTVKDFVDHKKISVKPENEPNSIFYHYSLPAFDNSKEPNEEVGIEIKSNKYQVFPFSILMSKLNPITPRIWDIYSEPEENSICSTEFQVLVPKDKVFFPFISTLLKSRDITCQLAMSASGTSGSHQRIKPEDILNIEFSVPSIDKMKEFAIIVEANFLKIVANQKQIKILSNLRDTLLPKLMSGEVRIKYEF